jgi:hypothetical protein
VGAIRTPHCGSDRFQRRRSIFDWNTIGRFTQIRANQGNFGEEAFQELIMSSGGSVRVGKFHQSEEVEMHLVAVFLLLLFAASPAAARDNGQWADHPAYLRQWFQKLMQPDNPVMSCCGEADAFEADSFEVRGDQYVAIITDGKGMIPEGTKIPVPNNKMKWDDGNPTGHGIIFIGNGGQVYCYVAPGGV